jgi:hypothetical protein
MKTGHAICLIYVLTVYYIHAWFYAPTSEDVIFHFRGAAGAVIPAGSIHETSDNRRFILREEVTLDDTGIGSGIGDEEKKTWRPYAKLLNLLKIPTDRKSRLRAMHFRRQKA